MFDYQKSRDSYKSADLSYYANVASCQRAKDEQFIEILNKYLKPGTVLEIGAGYGQLSEILKNNGYDVTSSDVQPFFIDLMKSKGLNALFVDALDIFNCTKATYTNILAQGPSPLITSDLSIVEKSYRSVFEALNDGGRFILIFAHAYGFNNFCSINNHLEIIKKVNFQTIDIFKHQVFPSSFYGKINLSLVKLIESSLGKLLGIRYVIVLEK